MQNSSQTQVNLRDNYLSSKLQHVKVKRPMSKIFHQASKFSYQAKMLTLQELIVNFRITSQNNGSIFERHAQSPF